MKAAENAGSYLLMAPKIHPTASLEPEVEIAPGVEIGPYVCIGKAARIGPGCKIMAHAVIGDYTELGPGCRVFSHAVVGSASQDLKHEPGTVSWLKIGARNQIREFTTLNRATAAGGCTEIGDDNLFMAYAHVAHDCQIGNRVVLANGTTLGGHVQIGNDVVIGAMSGIHQFTQIGRLVMIGAMSRVCNDVPPFMLATGAPPKVYGLNSVGLRRAKLPRQTRQILKQAFQILYRRSVPLEEALRELETLSQAAPAELQDLLNFVRTSHRGLVGAARSDQEIPEELR